MAFDLNPLAVTAAPLLRAIRDGAWTTRGELAEAAGRLSNHIARDIGSLVKAGLAEERAAEDCGKPVVLTDDGEAQLAALDRAANPDAGGPLTALHADLEPHPLNPRKDFESDAAEEGLNELRESILLRQLMQPIVVRPRPDQPGKWWIVDGERRWRAIGQAISDADWDDDRPIPIVPRAVDDREHLLLSLTANLQRSDMAAIEEAVAFNAAVQDFGITTEQLADELGKSRRYVQQRIALLKLGADDQDRMRLPKDHPEHLSFKAARSLSQTPRALGEPDRPLPHEEFSQMVAAQPHLTPAVASEPGSPSADPEPPSFGKSLTDKEALLLVEICDKSERDPDADLGSEGYTRVQNVPVAGAAASLVAKNAIGFRNRGATVLVTPRLHSTGAKAWLEEIGFYQHRADVLFEMRVRVHGFDAADNHNAEGTYATPWLNQVAEPEQDAARGKPLSEVFSTWRNGTPYERQFDRHNPERTAASFAPDLPWGDWRDRPLTDFIDAARLETFCLGNLPTGRDDYPDALIEVAPLLGGEGWVYGAGYSTSQYAHQERLRLVSDSKEAFPDRETAIAAGVDLIRDSLGNVSKGKLPVRTYDWTVVMLNPATRPLAKNAARDAEPEQGELIVPTPEEAEAIAAAKSLNARRETARSELRFLTASALQAIDHPDFMTQPATRRDCANLALDLLRANEPAKAIIALAGALVEYRDGASRPTGLRGPDCDSGLVIRHRIRSLEEL